MTGKEAELFEDFNKIIEQTFDELISSISEDNLFKLDENMISESLKVKEVSWQKEGKVYLDGLTPEQFFSTIKDTDILLKMFELAAITCDRDIPDVLTQTLIDAGANVEERLLDIALDEQYRRDTENIVIAAAAIFVLGNTHRAEVVQSLLTVLLDCREDDALIMESITDALKQFDGEAIDTICNFIQIQDNLDYRIEYLVMILPELSKDRKSDEVYRLIKNSFSRMDNKILGASALAEYGDGRAIPVLRGFLEKNAKNLDKETFFEIKKSIELLGGNIEGLVLPSFTQKQNMLH